MVMDMGLHAIPTLVEPQQIIQVLIPGVEERARHLPPLTSSSRLMPGVITNMFVSDRLVTVQTGPPSLSVPTFLFGKQARLLAKCLKSPALLHHKQVLKQQHCYTSDTPKTASFP